MVLLSNIPLRRAKAAAASLLEEWPAEDTERFLALGYAGWAPGQLETEIQSNGWLHCAADSELIFGPDIDNKYEKALKKIGIALGMLSNEAGHA